MPFDPVTYGAAQVLRTAAETAQTAAEAAQTAAEAAQTAAELAETNAEATEAQLAAGVASPAGTYANLTALISANPDHDNIYITLDDGAWCYYDSGTSAFVAGGVYQAATALAPITDAGNLYAAANVENALQEVKGNLDTITSCKAIPLTSGVYYVTNGSSVNLADPKTDASWDSAVFACTAGDEFCLGGTAGSTPRLWCFAKSDGTIISNAAGSSSANNLVLTAPVDSSYLVCNFLTSFARFLYKGIPVYHEVELIYGSINDLVTLNSESVAGYKEETRSITGCEVISLTEWQHYDTSGSTVDVNSPIIDAYNPLMDPTWASAAVPCVEDDAFTITGTGGSAPRLWCFVDGAGNIIDVEIDSTSRDSLELFAPAGSAFFVVNVLWSENYSLLKGHRTNKHVVTESYENKDTISRTIIVDANGHGDYATIHDAYDAIKHSSYYDQYEIIVLPGVYSENNLIPPPHTHTHGLYPNSVVITSEGLDTAYSVIDQRWWSSKLSNLTVISYTKYCIHYDYRLEGGVIVNENLRLIQTRTANNSIIGGGTFDKGTKYIWNNCIFEGGDIHCHTSGSCANYNNTHNIFNKCKAVNANYYAQSTGGFGHCVYEINGSNTKIGETTINVNLTQTLRTVDEPWTYFANGCEWQVLGANNKNMRVNFLANTGEGLMFETANANESLIISGSAVKDLFGHVRYKNGSSRFKGTGSGIYLVKDEQAGGTADVYQMWKRLGDCSSVNKTLSVTIGATTETYTFNQNYDTAKTAEGTIIAAVNAVITIAVLKKYTATTAWDNIGLEEKQYIKIAEANGVLAGEWLKTNGTICANNEVADDVYGIALENGVLNEVIPVWIGNVYAYTAANGEYGITSGVLASGATEKIGKVVSNVFIRYA